MMNYFMVIQVQAPTTTTTTEMRGLEDHANLWEVMNIRATVSTDCAPTVISLSSL